MNLNIATEDMENIIKFELKLKRIYYFLGYLSTQISGLTDFDTF